jgi:uncharacterized OsmC-like protein
MTMATIAVTHLAEDRFRIEVRGHELVVDQPGRDRDEAGPSPVELFVSSLAACVGHYGARFLRSRGVPYDGLRVECDWSMLAATHARVGRVRLRVTPPAQLPAELHAPLQEAMEHCTVHNSLRQPPQVTITMAETLARR